MEEDISLPRLTIQIPCLVKDRAYNLNYLSEESLWSRRAYYDAPYAWEESEKFSKVRNTSIEKCCEFKLYQGKDHIATLLIDLNTEVPEQRLVEVQLHGGSQAWLTAYADKPKKIIADGLDGYKAYFQGGDSTIYWSRFALKNYQNDIRALKYPLIKRIHEFVERICLPQGINYINKPLEQKKNNVEAILTDYAALNHKDLDVLGISASVVKPVLISEDIWKIHGKQLETLTQYGCISNLEGSFRHDDLDLALKIAVNPQLARCYEALDNCNSDHERIGALNAVCTVMAKEQASVDLTGMDFFEVFLSFVDSFEPGKLIEELKVPIVFDYAKFNSLDFVKGNEEGCNWAWVSLRHASFLGSQLSNINFIGTDLTSANFHGANLTDADLTCANIAGADFRDANLTGIKWPLLDYAAGDLKLPHLNWNNYGADFILQQLTRIGEDKNPTLTVGVKQARARQLIDTALSNIHTSEELIKFAALINGKENKFAYLREETLFGYSFFNCHGNTDTWHHIIGKLKVHLDILLVKETQSNLINPVKIWGSEDQFDAFQKIMSEHRGRWFGEVTHRKLYINNSSGNQYSTFLPSIKDKKKLRDSYIAQDKEFAAEIKKPKNLS